MLSVYNINGEKCYVLNNKKKQLCILHNNIVDFQRLREYVYIILKWINTYFNTLIKIRFLGI